MAEVQDFDSNEGSEDIGELETVEKQHTEAPAEPELPARYRGKTLQEVIRMDEEAQKLIARQGQEVGEVRKLADELIKSTLTPKPVKEEAKPVDFFENPQEAIRQQIENHPRVQAAEQYARQAQAEQARQRLNQVHPDVLQIVGDEGFKNWVTASKIRQQLFKQADEFDFDAANELLSTYKELRAVKQQKVAEVDNTDRDLTLKQVAVDTGGSGETTRKIYRRADLIRLKMRDPNKYADMQNEIMDAYAQGRVK
jgi:hypothetical protein